MTKTGEKKIWISPNKNVYICICILNETNQW